MAEDTEIYLIRHGQTVSNTLKRIQGQSDSPLTEFGVQQAHQVGKRLPQFKLNHLFTSPLGRAKTTAEIIGSYTGLKPSIEERLQEISFGDVEGLTWKDVENLHPERSIEWRDHHNHIALPGGESRTTAVDRASSAINEISERFKGEKIAVVTHGGILAALFAWILKIPSGERPQCLIENTSVNIIRIRDGAWKIKTWGDVSHLHS